MSRVAGAALVLSALTFVAAAGPVDAAAPGTLRVSTTATGGQISEHSERPAVSEDGRYVVFETRAALDPSDTGGFADVYRKDRVTGRVLLISRGDRGNLGDADSYDARISGDGNVILFRSEADNLGDTPELNGQTDSYVRDVRAGTTRRVNALDGSEPNGDSSPEALSADGSTLLINSTASNLVASDTNGMPDLFVGPVAGGPLELVAHAPDGSQGNGFTQNGDLSGDGRIVTFSSDASNLVADDTNGASDVFALDRDTGSIARLNVSNSGGQTQYGYDPSISDDGRFVAYDGYMPPVVGGGFPTTRDVMVHDRLLHTTTRISAATGDTPTSGPETHRVYNGQSFGAEISGDGSTVTFISSTTNLVDDDTNGHFDVFRHDRAAFTTTRVSVDSEGVEANGETSDPDIDGDGSVITYSSSATNLVPNDTNGVDDIFVRDLDPPPSPALVDYVVFANAGPATGSPYSDLFAIRPDGTGLVNLTTTPSIDERYPRVSPDGTRILFEATGHVWVAPIGDLNDRTELVVGAQPAWIDDGHFVYTGTGVVEPVELFTANVDGTGATQLTPSDGVPRIDPDVSPDGHYLTYSTLNYFGPGQPTSPDRVWLKHLGGPEADQPIDTGIRPSFNPAVTSPFELLYNTNHLNGFWQVWRARLDGSLSSPITTDESFFKEGGRASSDGQTVVFSQRPNDNENAPFTLQLIDIDGGNKRPLYQLGTSHEAGWARTACLSTACVPPGSPTDVVAAAGNGRISATWNAPDGATPVDSYTLSVRQVPGGPTTTTTVDGTKTSAAVGGLSNGAAYTVSVTAENEAGTSQPGTAPGTVTPVSMAPRITSAPTKAIGAGKPLNFNFNATGNPDPTMTANHVPSWITFTPDPAGRTATLTGTGPATGGAFTFELVATNSKGTDRQWFTVSVLAFTSSAAATFQAGQPNSFTIATTNTPPATLRTPTTLPTGITFVDNGDGTGTLSGTPSGVAHTKVFTIKFVAESGSLTQTQAFKLTIEV
jgi:hypothetical protein